MNFLPNGKMPRFLLLLCAAGAVVFVACLLFGVKRIDHSRVYSIGYGNDIPFHFRGPDGLPKGLAVDLVSEAARRKGIQLRWVEGEQPQMDLKVLVTIRPERLKKFHITDPYLETETCFVVLADSPVHKLDDLKNAQISFLDYGIHRNNLDNLLPNSKRVPVASSVEAIAKVSQGLSDAAYVDQYSVLAALLKGGIPVATRIVPSHVKERLGIAAPFATARVADEIRRGMASMADDGTVAAITERWGFLPNLASNMIGDLMVEQRRVQWLACGGLVLLILLFVTIWLAVRLRRQAAQLIENDKSLRQSYEELQTAMDQVRTLSGLLPICSFCKKIRNDQGYWSQIDTYIMQHSRVEFTHGLCPECIKRHYSDYDKDQPENLPHPEDSPPPRA